MRNYKVKIDVDATIEFEESVKWYNEQVERLGDRFERHVKIQINSLKINPNLYPYKYPQIRCLPLFKYPFNIFFTIDEIEKLVVIRAIFHSSRNPEILFERIY
ncbi:MAG: hypothetical protein V4683_17935 [Bacteroidota bacterium]